MAQGFVSLLSLVVVMSASNAVWGQQSWLISNPWGHEPLVRSPVQQAAYPQRPPFQSGYPQRPAAYHPPPQHWHTAHTNQHSAGVGPAPGVGTAAGAPGAGAAAAAVSGGAPATTAAIPAEVEPLEIEGPTTTTPPPTPAPYRYPPVWNQQQPPNRYPPPPAPRGWVPPNNWRATQGGQTSNQYQTRPNQHSGYPNQQPQSAVPAPSAGSQYQPRAGSPNTNTGQKSNDLYQALAGVIVQSLERKNLLPNRPPGRPPPAVTTVKPPLSSPPAEPVETEVPTTTTPPPTTRRSLPAWVQQQQQQPRPPTPARTQGAQESQKAWASDWLTKQIHLQVQPQPSVPVPNVPHPPQGHYAYQPPVQAGVPPQAPAANGNAMSRYDVFSSQFDSQAFHAAREQARVTTTPDPMKVLSQALGALGVGGGSGSGTGTGSGSGAGTGSGSGAQWGSSFSQPGAPALGPPRTSPRPPTTTPDFRVAVNPYRQGGFYLAPTDLKARPKPTTQIIETHQSIPADGVTAFNPFEGFLGNTPPPEKKATTPLPGKNGDHFAGFLGFHEATTASPRSDVNAVNPKYAQYFAPVPVDNGPAQNTASGTSSSWTGSGSATNPQQSASAVLSQLSPTQLAQALCQISPGLCAGQGGSAPAGRR